MSVELDQVLTSLDQMTALLILKTELIPAISNVQRNRLLVVYGWVVPPFSQRAVSFCLTK